MVVPEEVPPPEEPVPPAEEEAAAAPEAAAAQQEPQREKRWKGSAELSYTDNTGNRTLRLLTGGLRASHLQKDLFRLDLSLQSRYGEGNEGVIARNHHGSLAFDLRPEDIWSPFLFVEAEHDRFKRVDVRGSGGFGAKYTMYRSRDRKSDASVSLAMLLSHERLIASEADPMPDSRTIGRWSLRIRGSQELPTGVRLQHVSFYQPMVDEMADYLLRSESGVRVSLIQRLGLSLVYEHRRTARPPEGVSPDDRVVKTGLIFDF